MNNQQIMSGAVVGAVIAAVVGFGLYSMYEQKQKHDAMVKAVAPFEERMKEFTSLPKPPPGDIRGANPKKKMITVEPLTLTVDWLWFELPPELRATSPDDVETVVWLEYGEERIAGYEGGGWAIRYTCKVTVFDWATKKVVAQTDIKGTEPPRATNTPAGESDYGEKPTDKIVFYLRTIAGL